MESIEIIEKLYTLVTELDARESSFNCVTDSLIGISWNRLCDMGIDLLVQLKDQSKKEFYIEDHAKEIHQLQKELDNIIDYDEWVGREYGETKVDYYWTAVNLLKAGYRKVENEMK